MIRNHDSVPDEDDLFLMRVADKARCQIEVILSNHRVTLPRRMEMLRNGEIDLVIGASKVPEREAFGYFSLPYRTERIRVWARVADKTRVQGKTAPQLIDEGWRLIGPGQGWFGTYYEGLQKQPNKVIEFKQFSQGVRLLVGKRGDLLLGDEVWPSRLEAADQQALYQLPDLLHEDPVYILYSRKTVDESVVARMDVAIKALGIMPATSIEP
ncbi:transporter substrate-binding domain-containing protein [Permianibacter sp. IMCC34836]|uniref:substrate-binding periplasmic protein n=1 Tax=Permianibacter fluminis TaxID=2738515 RepID=UPI0015565DD0|nr:transporter substrate-binding domain-containing protein [Permianibacter fluminis]NQD37234.1 transporter substrate-binding domain-containing protein [Permianibacter fluminis]